MTLPEIDKSIAGWNARLGAAAQNLVDLQSLPAYQRLAGTNGVPMADLTGETAAAVKPALATISRLLQYFDLLQHMVIRAEELRSDMPVWNAEARIREIELLLSSPSIELPAVPVPIDRRSLLSSVENVEKIVPADLLRLMADAFEQSKSVVMSVDAAWEFVGRRVEAMLAEIAGLRAETDAAGLADLDAAVRAVEQARTKGEHDPFAARTELAQNGDGTLARVRAKVAEIRQLRKEIDTGFAVCRALWESLLKVHEETVAAYQDASGKVRSDQPLPTPASEAAVQGLREWLDRIQVKYGEGVLQPIAAGIRNWNKAAEQCVSSDRRVLLASRGLLEQRAELRGRLDALKAKARARGVAEHDELSRTGEECRAILFSRPTDLARGAALVEAYEKQLNALT